MQKSQTQAIVLPFWTFAVLVTALVGLFPALLYCIGEIVVLKSRFEQQQQTIEYLENVTAHIQRRTVENDFSSGETQEAYQSLMKWKVWRFYVSLVDNFYFERPRGLRNRSLNYTHNCQSLAAA